MLFNDPIGTIVGLFFLPSIIKSKDLFGPDRLLHTDIRREFLARKAIKRKRGCTNREREQNMFYRLVLFEVAILMSIIIQFSATQMVLPTRYNKSDIKSDVVFRLIAIDKWICTAAGKWSILTDYEYIPPKKAPILMRNFADFPYLDIPNKDLAYYNFLAKRSRISLREDILLYVALPNLAIVLLLYLYIFMLPHKGKRGFWL